MMKLWQKFYDFCRNYDKHTDEISEKAIWDEYLFLFRLSLFYPNLSSQINCILHLIQFVLYAGNLTIHIYVIFTTVFKSEPEDFLTVTNSAHFGFIILLFLTFIFFANFVRQDICGSHKIIGNGVYIYEDEEVTEEETAMKRKYFKIKRNLKTILPAMNIVAGLCVVIVGPWLDEVAGNGDSRTYTDSGIYLKLPVPAWYPIDVDYGINFYICFLGQLFCAYLVIIILTSATCAYFTSTIHVIIQLERLILSIKTLEKRAFMLYKERKSKCFVKLKKRALYEDLEFLCCIEKCFRRSIQHHQQIIRLNRHVNTLARRPVFATFFAGGVILGISALIITSGAEKPGLVLGTLSVAVTELANITAICKAGQTITDLNEKFNETLYDTSWYRCSRNMKSNLKVMQTMATQDMIINGMFNTVANMETYGNILNTAYSYFSLLIAFNNN